MKRQPGNYRITLNSQLTCPHCGLPPDFPVERARHYVVPGSTTVSRTQCGECDKFFTAQIKNTNVEVIAI